MRWECVCALDVSVGFANVTISNRNKINTIWREISRRLTGSHFRLLRDRRRTSLSTRLERLIMGTIIPEMWNKRLFSLKRIWISSTIRIRGKTLLSTIWSLRSLILNIYRSRDCHFTWRQATNKTFMIMKILRNSRPSRTFLKLNIWWGFPLVELTITWWTKTFREI